MDRYGQPEETGKPLDDDIQAGNLTWPLVHAWKHASKEQKKIILVSPIIKVCVSNLWKSPKNKRLFPVQSIF